MSYRRLLGICFTLLSISGSMAHADGPRREVSPPPLSRVQVGQALHSLSGRKPILEAVFQQPLLHRWRSALLGLMTPHADQKLARAVDEGIGTPKLPSERVRREQIDAELGRFTNPILYYAGKIAMARALHIDQSHIFERFVTASGSVSDQDSHRVDAVPTRRLFVQTWQAAAGPFGKRRPPVVIAPGYLES